MVFSGCRLKSSALCPRENKVVIIVQRITRCVVGYRGIVVRGELVAPVAVAVGVCLVFRVLRQARLREGTAANNTCNLV